MRVSGLATDGHLNYHLAQHALETFGRTVERQANHLLLQTVWICPWIKIELYGVAPCIVTHPKIDFVIVFG
jgi:hypothetical protein